MQSLEDIVTNVDAPYRIVPIVLPIAEDPAISGKIRYLRCAPAVSHKMLQAYIDEDGRVDWGITPKFARQGYVLLRDLFEQEERHEDWQQYERMLRDINANKRNIKPFPDDKLPKEVHRRRACGHEPEPVKSGKGSKAGESAMSGRTA